MIANYQFWKCDRCISSTWCSDRNSKVSISKIPSLAFRNLIDIDIIPVATGKEFSLCWI
ncbi:hypothetical protein H6G04_30745 [Calothrix membranacea FACHB-236]|nr:hypothetical protein [Calothrix membranacea FACHB-236]